MATTINPAGYPSGYQPKISSFRGTGGKTIDTIQNNLIHQSDILSFVRKSRHDFPGLSMRLVEGVYVPEENEELTADGFLDLRTQGRACAYEVIGMNGNIDVEGTFSIASYIAERTRYDRLCLDYDNYHPSGCLNAQILIETPKYVPEQKTRFKMHCETCWNSTQIGNGEFVLLDPKPV